MDLTTRASGASVSRRDEVRRFRADGFVIARGLADPATCARLLAVMRDHLHARGRACRVRGAAALPRRARIDGCPGRPHDTAPAAGVRARCRVPRLGDFAARCAQRLRQLIGPQVQLAQAHHNCVMTKQPRYSSVTGWHQDIRYWSFERPELVSVWLALGREHPDNGCLSLIPGSHLLELSPERLDERAVPARGAVREPHPHRCVRHAAARARRRLVFPLPHLPRGGREPHSARRSSRWCSPITRPTTGPLPGTRSASLPDVSLETAEGEALRS